MTKRGTSISRGVGAVGATAAYALSTRLTSESVLVDADKNRTE